MAVSGAGIYGYDPFLSTRTAQLMGDCDRWTKNYGQNRYGIEELSQAELVFNHVYRLWKSNHEALLNEILIAVAKGDTDSTWSRLPDDVQRAHSLPPPFTDWHSFRGNEWNERLMEAEWLVSATLEATYVLCERFASVSRTLNTVSSNLIWKDVTLGAAKERNVEINLVNAFAADIGDVRHQENITKLIEARGLRIHQNHLYVHVEIESKDVVYQSRLPWDRRTGKMARFTAHELNLQLFSLVAFTIWWTGKTQGAFEALSK